LIRCSPRPPIGRSRPERIEWHAVIGDLDGHALRLDRELDADLMRAALRIAVHDAVGDEFFERQPNAECDLLIGACFIQQEIYPIQRDCHVLYAVR